MSTKPSHCLECFKRSLTNKSGRAVCNGRAPCKWCKSKNIACSYEYDASTFGVTIDNVPDFPASCIVTTPVSPTVRQTPEPSSAPTHAPTRNEDTRMIISNFDNGDIRVRFVPDPENLGSVDPFELGEDINPEELPIDNYEILVKAAKRKRAATLTTVEHVPPPAKRLRGGVDNAFEDDGNTFGRRTPTPIPPPPPGQSEELIRSFIEATQATTQMFQQMMDNGEREHREVARQSARGRKIHRLDLVEEDETLSKIDSKIPKIIVHVFEKGWKRHFSFFLLTDDYCESPEAHKLPGDKLVLGQGNTIHTQSSELPTGGRDEAGLTLAEYMQASPRFILLVKDYLGEDLAAAWEVHCNRILTHSRRDKIWHLLMLYDISIRRRATDEPLRPQNWHQDVFDQIETDWNRDQNDAQRNTLATQSAALQAQLAQFANHSIRTNQRPSNPPPQQKSEAPPSYRAANNSGKPAASTAVAGTTLRPGAPGLPSPTAPQPSLLGLQTKIGRWTARLSATTTTATRAAQAPPALAVRINAPPVVPSSMAPSRAPASPLSNTRTVAPKLIANAWETMLCDLGLLDEFGDIPSGLREGFRIGAAGPVRCTIIHRNHKSALDRPHIIDEHIKAELDAGRYLGPFTREDLESRIGPFQTAPLGTVDKASAPGKFRIVQDFSFPRTTPSTSLNAQIDSDQFQCVWGFFHDVKQALYDLPPGSLAATCDVDAAFRQIPIHPDDRPHTVVGWNGMFYLDAFLPFGVASANGLFGRPGDAMARIYSLRGFGIILKWVDDFLFIQSPVSPPSTNPSRFSIEAIYELARLLGWPWKPSKTAPFANLFVYLGFEWDIARKWVSLPAAKRKKYLQRIRDWISTGRVSLNETEKLSGTLIHCTLAIPSGRPRVAALLAFEASFPQAHSERFLRKQPSSAALTEANWWINTLSSSVCGSSIAKPPPTCNIRIASDASTSFGLGVIIEDQWWSWRLLGGWKADCRDIGWAEAVALDLAVSGVIASGIRDASITCSCDNQGVVYAWAAGRSRNPQQNAVFMSIMEKAAGANLSINVVYIRSEDNPADEPSRGVAPSLLSRAYSTIPIPPIYAPFIASATL